MSTRTDQVADQLMHIAADFFARESNRQSLITVTRASVTPNLRSATIYFTVLPFDKAEQALSFAKRMRTDFRTYMKHHTSFKQIPFIDFEIDDGEKRRQRIDEILR